MDGSLVGVDEGERVGWQLSCRVGWGDGIVYGCPDGQRAGCRLGAMELGCEDGCLDDIAASSWLRGRVSTGLPRGLVGRIATPLQWQSSRLCGRLG